MKNFKWMCLIIALLALIANDVWARGGGGTGGGHSAGGGGHSFGGGRGRHIGGGRHFRGGGHRHFRGGGHRHFRGGFRSHRHFRGGFFNYGFGYGGYRGYGRYGGFGYRGYPATVSAPIVYIQREAVTPVQQQTNYWHYCRNPDGYYPYVKQCPGGWLQVAPQPPAP